MIVSIQPTLPAHYSAHCLISDNLIRTSKSQIAAIRVDAVIGTQDVVICSNTLVGDNRRILVEGPAAHKISTTNNQGAKE